MEKKMILIGLFYYIAYMLVGTVFVLISGTNNFFATIAFCLLGIGLLGLLSFFSIDVIDEFSIWFKILGVIRRVISILLFCFLILIYVGQYENVFSKELTTISALMLATACTPITYILIRSASYSFTFEVDNEYVKLIVGMVLPLVCFGISIGLMYISPIWGPLGLFVVWIFFLIFVRGYLTGFPKFLFNFVFYGIVLGLAIYFVTLNSPFQAFGFLSMAMCFWFYVGIDLCGDNNFFYWFFNIPSIVFSLLFFIVGMVGLNNGDIEGVGPGFSFSFEDAVKNAIFFMPYLYVCFRPALYKLSVENCWEEGLSDVFVTLLLPLVCFGLAIPILMVGILYIIWAIVLIVGAGMLVMYFKDFYIPVPDFAKSMRENLDNYIVQVTIID